MILYDVVKASKYVKLVQINFKMSEHDHSYSDPCVHDESFSDLDIITIHAEEYYPHRTLGILLSHCVLSMPQIMLRMLSNPHAERHVPILVIMTNCGQLKFQKNLISGVDSKEFSVFTGDFHFFHYNTYKLRPERSCGN